MFFSALRLIFSDSTTYGSSGINSTSDIMENIFRLFHLICLILSTCIPVVLVGQAIYEFPCQFSRENWIEDSTGELGYRHFVMVAVECPEFDTIFSKVSTTRDLDKYFGPPSSNTRQMNGQIFLTYNIYQRYTPNDRRLVMKLIWVINRWGQIDGALISNVGG
jgi:hypothetical protein